MEAFIAYTVFGIVIGAAYAIAASGLVLTYATSRVFNMAHGAVGMVMAFVYWELAVNQELPDGLVLVAVVGVIAPLTGALIERTMMRRLADAPVSVSLVVTVGLLVGLIGLAQAVWPPSARSLQGFFYPHGVRVGNAFVTVNDLLTVGLAVVVAGGLWLFLNRTRTGVAMRAVVDNPNLLALHGARPSRLSTISWAAGSALAALAGILLAPSVQLEYFQLTLLVINAYAAAMLGRLKSLPLTFAGALVLGLTEAYVVGYIPLEGALRGLQPAIPVLFLFLVALLLPQAQLRVGQLAGVASVPVPTVRRAALCGLALVAGVTVVSSGWPQVRSANLALGMVYGTLMLSLVLLTGYGGYVSLAQFTFAGVGAVVVAKSGSGSPLVLLLGALVAAAVGALVALPVLRLRGLYLALSTLAFAQLMDKLVFESSFAFGYGGNLATQRLTLFGMTLSTERSYLVLATVMFAAVGVLLISLRRGPYGRVMLAMRESPAACGTLGLNLVSTRVTMFALSAGIAGLAGGVLAGMRESAGASDFQLFNSLPLLLLAVVGGATSVTGALLGGIVLMLLPVLQSNVPALGGVVFLLVGAAAVSLGRNPNGVASYLFRAGHGAAALLHRGPRTASGDPLAPEPVEVRAGATAQGRPAVPPVDGAEGARFAREEVPARGAS